MGRSGDGKRNILWGWPNTKLLNLSLVIFMEHLYFGIFQLCLLGCYGWFLLVLVEIIK